MKRELVIQPEASEDADSIFAWIYERSQEGAVAWWKSFRNALDDLSKNTDGCGLAPESSQLSRPVKQQFFKTRRGIQHRILFEITDEHVIVLRVHREGQDLLD
ncbi:MAG: type II toxin-antitoxin system RelE/ParE family toxin [Planctomycetaceae bacterium]